MTNKGAYQVFVDDNFHYMDEEYRYLCGTYDNWEGAVIVCKRIVDDFLKYTYKPGMTPEELWKHYRWFGEDPFILGPEPDSATFSAWTYAKERCAEICR
jgi:hypothetical protein